MERWSSTFFKNKWKPNLSIDIFLFVNFIWFSLLEYTDISKDCAKSKDKMKRTQTTLEQNDLLMLKLTSNKPWSAQTKTDLKIVFILIRNQVMDFLKRIQYKIPEFIELCLYIVERTINYELFPLYFMLMIVDLQKVKLWIIMLIFALGRDKWKKQVSVRRI